MDNDAAFGLAEEVHTDLTGDELDLILGGSSVPSGGQLMDTIMEHVVHVGTYVGIGATLGGPPGAMMGFGAGLAHEAYEHSDIIVSVAEQVPAALESYQDNPPPI